MEDDYDTEYRYDRRPVPALQPRDPEHVAYASGLSKAPAPALRLGWLIAPAPLREDLVRTRLATVRALEAGIAVDALSAHRRGDGPPGLVIGYGPHPPVVMDRAIETLGRLLRP